MKIDIVSQLTELEQNYKSQRAELLDKVKVQLAAVLSDALKLYSQIPPDVRQGVFSEDVFTKILGNFGLVQGKSKSVKKSRTATPKVEDNDILTFLDTQKTTGEVEAHFKLSAVTVSKRLKALKEKNQVTMEPQGTKKLWKRV